MFIKGIPERGDPDDESGEVNYGAAVVLDGIRVKRRNTAERLDASAELA
jgi:hypothetical protein